MPEITTTVEPQGHGTRATTDLLEDFWFDYQVFQRDARVANRNRDPLKVQRFLRAGLVSFINHVQGLANRWQAASTEPNQPTTPMGDGYSRPTLSARLVALAEQRGGAPPPTREVDFLTALASRSADLQPADESALFADLSLERVEAAEQEVATWLDEFSQATGLPRHADTRPIGLGYASASEDDMISEIDQAFEAIADEPHPFQDDPAIWGDDPASQPPPSRARD